MLPILFVIFTAFKTDTEISIANFRWFPSSFMNFEGFKQAWKMGDWLAYFKNSILITVLVVIGSLIINSLAGSFGIFLCRQFYLSFPKELDESARMDGCGPLRTYFYIFLPMSKTVLATLTILKGVSTWNDFFYPLIMTNSERMKTVQLGLQMFKGSTATHYNWLMAATLITSIPMVILYFCAQKYFVQGIASTGMKN